MKHILSLLFFALFANIVCGQTYRQYMKAADEELFEKKVYYAAMKFYQKAMEIEGETPEVLYKYGEAARLQKAFTFADTAYTKVLRSEQAKEYPLTAYWLAMVKKEQGYYADAQLYFKQFLASNPRRSNGEEVAHADQEVRELDWAIEAIKIVDDNVEIEQLDTHYVNSAQSEVSPVLWNNQLYFTSQKKEIKNKEDELKKPFARVYQMKEGSRKIDLALLNDEKKQTANIVFSPSGKRVYYTLCEYVGESTDIRCDIFYRNIINNNGDFSEPMRLSNEINKDGFTATQPTVGYDEATGKEWIYYVSDRPGGKGGMDIWASEATSDSTFSQTYNLTEVNTEGNEVSPFYHNINKHLYFSSDGRKGFGAYDIYKINFASDRRDEPEHMPSPYNTSYNDWYYWLNETQTRGFFASSRLGSHVLEPEFQSCCDDLYAFTIQVIKLNLLTFNRKNSLPLEGVTIELFEHGKEGELKLATVTNPTSNDFTFDLKKGTKYSVLATRDGFLPLRDTVDLSIAANTKTAEIERKLYLVPTTVDLHVTSFNKRTNNPLKGVEVRLVVEGQEIDFKKNEVSNNVDFTLDRGKMYQIIGSKVAYFSDTAFVDLRFDKTSTDIDQKLFLRPKEIEDFPPLVIYFDNDQPNPKTRKTTTEVTYEQSWKEYMDRREIYRQEYVKSLVGQDSFVASRRIEAFFDREVNNGFLSLQVFSESVMKILEDGGFKVELVIQGFTSPRADASYNFDLSQRRSDCLKNHFEAWNGGVLKPYIDKNMLVLKVVGYGEKLAPQYISDRLDDERESIYSVTASFERKVAIIGARRVADN